MKRTCATCKWMRDPGHYAKCVSPKNMIKKPNRTGFEKHRSEFRYEYCLTHRDGSFLSDLIPVGACGSLGWWWEKK